MSENKKNNNFFLCCRESIWLPLTFVNLVTVLVCVPHSTVTLLYVRFYRNISSMKNPFGTMKAANQSPYISTSLSHSTPVESLPRRKTCPLSAWVPRLCLSWHTWPSAWRAFHINIRTLSRFACSTCWWVEEDHFQPGVPAKACTLGQ